MDQNGRPLEIEEKVDFTLLDDTLFKLSNEMLFYRTKNKKIRGYGFLSFMRNLFNNYWVLLLKQD